MRLVDGDPETTGAVEGRPSSGDDVADCAALRRDAGRAPLVAPTAFTWHGSRFVVSASGVPAAVSAEVTPSGGGTDRAQGLALEAAADDWVDGPRGGCFTAARAGTYAGEVLRGLGLRGWSVRTVTGPGGPGAGPCASLEVAADQRVLRVVADARLPVTRGTPEVADRVLDVADALRARVSGACLSRSAAASLARDLVGADGQVSVVADEARACAGVDLVVGGGLDVTVRGPAVARG